MTDRNSHSTTADGAEIEYWFECDAAGKVDFWTTFRRDKSGRTRMPLLLPDLKQQLTRHIRKHMKKLKLREAHGTIADTADGYDIDFYKGVAGFR
jgi:hypothetical protein